MTGFQLEPKFGTTLSQATDLLEINAITDLVKNIIIIPYFCNCLLTDRLIDYHPMNAGEAGIGAEGM